MTHRQTNRQTNTENENKRHPGFSRPHGWGCRQIFHTFSPSVNSNKINTINVGLGNVGNICYNNTIVI